MVMLSKTPILLFLSTSIALAAVEEPTQEETKPPVVPGVQKSTFHGSKAQIQAIAIAPDGKTIATAGADNMVRLWEPGTKKELKSFPNANRISCLAFSPDGKKLAVGDLGSVQIVEAGTGTTLASLKGNGEPFLTAIFSTDGQEVAASSSTSGGIWSIPAGKEKITFPGAIFGCIALSPDGKMLARADSGGGVILWDVTADKELLSLKGHGEPVRTLVFSPDGKTLATGGFGGGIRGRGKDKSIKLWDVATGKERATLVGHAKGLYLLAFAADGKTLLGADYNGSMKLWDVEKGRVKATLEKVKVGEKLQGTTVGIWAVSPDLRNWAVAKGAEIEWYDISDFTGAKK